MSYLIALVPAASTESELATNVDRLLDKGAYDELIVSERGEGFAKALKRAREVSDPIISMVSLGAIGKDAKAVYRALEPIVYGETEVALRFKHLDYRAIGLKDAPRNTVSGAGLKLLLQAVGTSLGVEAMIALDSDSRHKIVSSDRERIKELVRSGRTQKSIAKELGVSRATVARHWATIKLEDD